MDTLIIKRDSVAKIVIRSKLLCLFAPLLRKLREAWRLVFSSALPSKGDGEP